MSRTVLGPPPPVGRVPPGVVTVVPLPDALPVPFGRFGAGGFPHATSTTTKPPTMISERRTVLL